MLLFLANSNDNKKMFHSILYHRMSIAQANFCNIVYSLLNEQRALRITSLVQFSVNQMRFFCHLEVNEDSLEDLKIMCQRLSLDVNVTSELLSKKRLTEIFALLMKYNNNDLQRIVFIMAEFIPKIIGDLPSEVSTDRSTIAALVSILVSSCVLSDAPICVCAF